MEGKLSFFFILIVLVFFSCDSGGNEYGNSVSSRDINFEHAKSVKFYVDPSHSSIDFTVPFMGLTRVSGRFDHFFGEIYYDENDITNSSVEIIVRAASIDTRIKKRDDDVRKNYLEIADYPAITFRSNNIAQRDSHYVAIGQIAMHGTNREVEAPFHILNYFNEVGESKEMGLVVGPIKINREDYGITHGSLPGKVIEFTVLLRLLEPFDKTQEARYPIIDIDPKTYQPFIGNYKDESGKETMYIEFIENKLTARLDPRSDLAWNIWYQIVPYNDSPTQTDFRYLNHSSLYITFDKQSDRLIFRREGRGAMELVMIKSE